MLAAHGVEHQREIVDIAGHRALHPEIAVDRGGQRMRDAADARAHADDAAEARGVAQRAAHVGAVGEPRHAGGERHGGAAGGTRGGARSIPGIEGGAEHLVKRVGAGAEFRRVGLGVDHSAIVLEVLDQDIGARGDVVPVDRRALRRQHALDAGEVLDRYRHARQQAAAANRLLHQLPGMGPGAVETQRRQRVDLAVDLGDALFQHVEQIERRDFALVEFIDNGARRCLYQSLIGHSHISYSFSVERADCLVL